MTVTALGTRRASRALTAVLAAAVLALTGCSDDSGSSTGSGSGGDSEAANEFTAAGVSFAAPEGWEALDAAEAGMSGDDTADIAEGLGMSAEQLQATVEQVDLFVVDGDGPQDGFLSNINVLEQDGQLPEDAAIEQQFSSMGAQVLDVTHQDSEVGDVTAVEYSLPVQDSTVEGVSYLVARGDQVVTVTVSTPDRAQSTEIGDGIVASLAEAG
jgi:hypothetical protein